MAERSTKNEFMVGGLGPVAEGLIGSFCARLGIDPCMQPSDHDITEQKRRSTGQDQGYYRRMTAAPIGEGGQHSIVIQVGIRGVTGAGEAPHSHLIFTYAREGHVSFAVPDGAPVEGKTLLFLTELAFPLEEGTDGVLEAVLDCQDGSGAQAYFRTVDYQTRATMCEVTTKKTEGFDLGLIFASLEESPFLKK